MNLLVALVVGGLVGWMAAQVADRSVGIFAAIIIGVVGSLIGSFLSVVFTGSDRSFLEFSWVGIFWSFLGALLFVLLMNAVRGSKNSTT